MIDLALYKGSKGTLKLSERGLEFRGKREQFSIPLERIERVSFKKTEFVTSTLYVNDIEITVCRAHLWAAKIRELKGMARAPARA
ncbi:hypothetical protein GCM10007108_07360 [Thermogymnomonas acidicola]|uniref:Uncharacterized protein n=1 Tax=Thermogymnomonas acidicola TaxID=399579 RepID=A0AA37BQS7_9ARCH|nr:hypothetical protein GCM10007108_07360 [Thermogymnomonas acidicola]